CRGVGERLESVHLDRLWGFKTPPSWLSMAMASATLACVALACNWLGTTPFPIALPPYTLTPLHPYTPSSLFFSALGNE
ncbi:hypothetical protein, partial [Brasilonema sp. UFV-L1]|uniref:hypothetical protein n=1 Tax=Brasilonema sp. UFV-L1 TaxID=2234130 RepID=UPI001B7D092F